MSLPRLLRAILTLRNIQLATIGRPIRSAARLSNPDALKAFEPEALELRAKYRVPFWMAMNFVIEAYDVPIPEQILSATELHQRLNDASKMKLDREDCDAYTIRRLGKDVPNEHMLAILSRVTTSDGKHAHIPMIDFRSMPSTIAVANATSIVQRLGIDGFLLDSGNSYHFYGQDAVTEEELYSYLARALLYMPIVDHRWVAHQLIERQCALRVSPRTTSDACPNLVQKTRGIQL